MGMAQILAEKPKELIQSFYGDYLGLLNLNKEEHNFDPKEVFQELTEQWYEVLEQAGIESAYEVYGDKNYFVDIIHCFAGYSRRYLRDLYKPKMPGEVSFYDLTKNAKCIVDTGCGVSYSTIALKQMYPDAEVFATNLRGTKQWEFCSHMAEKHGFNMIEDVKEIEGEKVDFTFSSEYYEHFLDPMEHVKHITDTISPEYMVIANAFNTWSIGHFETYTVDGVDIDQKKISRKWNDYVRTLGYTKVKTKFFNNKPNIWQRDANA